MKDWLIIIGVLLLIIIFNVIMNNYTSYCADELEAKLDSIYSEIENSQNSKNIINQVMDDWNSQKKVLSLYIEHDELEKVENDLIALKCNIETEEVEDVIEKIEVVKFIANHIKDKYAVKLENVF